jgi:hypothetical protein
VAQRLYNIRHCRNIQGVPVPLPLYAPPINPLLLAEAQAAGVGALGATAPAPVYRFSTYLQKAVELANDVRSFGALVLSAPDPRTSSGYGCFQRLVDCHYDCDGPRLGNWRANKWAGQASRVIS